MRFTVGLENKEFIIIYTLKNNKYKKRIQESMKSKM